MDNINAKLQYLKGMADGISMVDGDKFLVVEEIISTLEVMAQESAKISERMQKEISRLQSLEFDGRDSFNHRTISKNSNFDYFDDITAPFPFKNQAKAADVWYDESLTSSNYLNPNGNTSKDREELKFERICNHCGSYVSCDISSDEVGNVRIQCPKCKRFLLPYDNQGFDSLSRNIDEQIDNLAASAFSPDFMNRLRSPEKSFNWELSEEDIRDDYDNQYDIKHLIKDFERGTLGGTEEEAKADHLEFHGDEQQLDSDDGNFLKSEIDTHWMGLTEDSYGTEPTQEAVQEELSPVSPVLALEEDQYGAPLVEPNVLQNEWNSVQENRTESKIENNIEGHSNYWEPLEDALVQPKVKQAESIKSNFWDSSDVVPSQPLVQEEYHENRQPVTENLSFSNNEVESETKSNFWDQDQSAPVEPKLLQRELPEQGQRPKETSATSRAEQAEAHSNFWETSLPPKMEQTATKANFWESESEAAHKQALQQANIHNEWKLQTEEKIETPQAAHATQNEWKLNCEIPEEVKREETSSGHEWKLNGEMPVQAEVKQVNSEHEWKLNGEVSAQLQVEAAPSVDQRDHYEEIKVQQLWGEQNQLHAEQAPVQQTWEQHVEAPLQPKVEQTPVQQSWTQAPVAPVQPRAEQAPVQQTWEQHVEAPLQPKVEQTPVQQSWTQAPVASIQPRAEQAPVQQTWEQHVEAPLQPKVEQTPVQQSWTQAPVAPVQPRTEQAPVQQAWEQHVEAPLQPKVEQTPVQQSWTQAPEAGIPQQKIEEKPIEEPRPVQVPVQDQKAQVVEAEVKEQEAEEEQNFDWNADFEFSIDKILSMDKKEATETEENSNNSSNSESRFNNENFGKFKYSFDNDDSFDRNRNKLAQNLNIDKRTLKNFSFLGYANELLKKNN